jgi:hypothetical protein
LRVGRGAGLLPGTDEATRGDDSCFPPSDLWSSSLCGGWELTVSGAPSCRSDLILLLFDSHKLDISDEFKEVIQALKDEDSKV